ncbi:hypothetical protein GIB67_020263 [Kingdonia uniflora]|uniref:DNA (cytosine-5-)-methyltransferase n=1 Tax=Kingdonia uniflora TaxID=39325 RepID=A0A7J7P3S1_9MAGN|nr:hypothetical protein GIB67_020263 [Kingdonia uniflora]
MELPKIPTTRHSSRRLASKPSPQPPPIDTNELVETETTMITELLDNGGDQPEVLIAEQLRDDDGDSETRRLRGKAKMASDSMLGNDDDKKVMKKRKSLRRAKAKTSNKKANSEASGPTSREKTEEEVVVDPYEDVAFVGPAVADEEARQQWPHRYKEFVVLTHCWGSNGEEELMQARCHYLKAEVDGVVYDLYDDVYVTGVEDYNYIGKIVEIFANTKDEPFFTAQWFYRALDTVITEKLSHLNDKRRVFKSDIKNDNLLGCLLSKLRIAQVTPNIDLEAKEATIPSCDYYYDMKYSLPYSTFSNVEIDSTRVSSERSTISTDSSARGVTRNVNSNPKSDLVEMTLLDVFAGCGAMSTGLCLGANKSGVKLHCGWAVDLNTEACKTLKQNHPETKVRDEYAHNFLRLLIEWEKLCRQFSLLGTAPSEMPCSLPTCDEDIKNDYTEVDPNDSSIDFEVEKLLDICYGDPNKEGNSALELAEQLHLTNLAKVFASMKRRIRSKKKGIAEEDKDGDTEEVDSDSSDVESVEERSVRWKGFSSTYDTWEPIKGLSDCNEMVQDFVKREYNRKLLPLPGDVDVICGGPPCQGASGFNRFRNKENPLADSKNEQVVVFMDIVSFLKPKYVLMENVVDIMKFANGYLGRYAMGRLVGMNYQTRLGMMAAGCYGVAQFRMRKLPQFPLPSHDLARVRGVNPVEFEGNIVGYEENRRGELEKAVNLEDAISDLPEVTNYEDRNEMPYGKTPKTNFQKEIRLSMNSMLTSGEPKLHKKLFDHCPLKMSLDDFQRVVLIPKKKGANFRDLGGLKVGPNNKVELDKSIERVYLPSKKPLVPDYAITFTGGTSTEPFRRLWWDETVPTVVTRAQPHNRAILHPTQDRVLTIRENARLQGFPDCYKLHGEVKDRYTQVGNAVAVPVARALGYSLGLAFRGLCSDEPLLTLPPKFPNYLEKFSSDVVEDINSERKPSLEE